MTSSYLDANFAVLAPAGALVVGALACLLLEVARPGLRRLVGPVAIAATVLSAMLLYLVGPTELSPGASLLAREVGTDVLVLAFAPAFYLAALGALVLGGPYLARSGKQRGEFQALVLFSTAGMLLLTQARDLLILFLALETLSIPLYVLVGFFTDRERSIEAALKYFTIGAFSSAFVALGLALTYGAAGTLDLVGVREGIAAATAAGDKARTLLAHGGLAFLLVGFGFKVAMAPFHSWAPDVYQGAPTPVTAFLGVGSKAAGLAGLVRLLVEVFPAMPSWAPLLAVFAALTLVVGNCVAMLQEDIKRLIAYSGVAHVGFLLMAVVAHQRLGPVATGRGLADLSSSPALQAIVFYLAAYALMTLGALTVVAMLEVEYGRPTMILEHAGLAARRPALAAAMLVFMLSLGGMPPLAGFVGKWLVFQSTVAAGLGWLAVIAAVTSIVGFYYYLRVVLQMYLRPPRVETPVAAGPGAWLLVGAALAGTVVLGVVPWLLLDSVGASGP